MIKESKFNQYGFPRGEEDIQGITVHETGNLEMDAQQLLDYYDNECKGYETYHYIVDADNSVQIMPDNWAVYHTGKSKDWGNRYTVSVAICSSLSNERYSAAEDKAVELIELLQSVYHIPNDRIFFHNDFNDKAYCPKTALDIYGSSKNFAYQRLYKEES